MAYLSSAIRSNTSSIPYENKPFEQSLDHQEISAVVEASLKNIKYSSDRPIKSLPLNERKIKLKLKTLFHFEMHLESCFKAGSALSPDGKFITTPSGKKILFAYYKENYRLMKTIFLHYLESQGLSYNTESGLLTNGHNESIELTSSTIECFFKNKEIIETLRKEFKSNNTVIEEVNLYDALDFEEVKSAVKLFMEHADFIELLKGMGWDIPEMIDGAEATTPQGKSCSCKNLSAMWRYQKNKVIQTFKDLGYEYDSKKDLFNYYRNSLSFDEVYDLVKHQVIDELIVDAQLAGFFFDQEKGLFIKGDSELTVREVVIQLYLSHIGLEKLNYEEDAMANSINAVQTNVVPIFESKPAEESSGQQEISEVAKETFQNANVKEPEEWMVKEKLKGIFHFDKLCELGKEKGATFSHDGKIFEDPSGKRLVADLEFFHTLMKDALVTYIESQGYYYNPVSELLTNGTVDTVSDTLKILKNFFGDQKRITALKHKLKDVTFEAIYDVIDFEEVKSTVKLFMDSKQFIPLLKKRGWLVYGNSEDVQIVNLKGLAFDLNTLDFMWKKQKHEVIQSLQRSGYAYNRIDDQFIYHKKAITIDQVYDLIKNQVVDQLVVEAHSIGYRFDIEKKLFVKEGSEASIREVMIQVHLKHMRLEDNF